MKTEKVFDSRNYAYTKVLKSETCYEDGTPYEVMELLEEYRANGKRIRIWLGDNKTGKSWNEENDIMGYIGRSNGTIKIPLLINNKRSMGGGALMSRSIVKMVDITTKKVIWEHTNFNQRIFGADDTLVWEGEAGDNETIYASCNTPEHAVRLADFMNGKRNSK